jgi:Family of unknown function (DUF6187)
VSEPENIDTRFAMPALDQPPLTEIGVILAGLDIERLLAGLGAAGDARGGYYGDPTQVVLLVDRLRHGGGDGLTAALTAGARRWLAARPALAAVDRVPSVSASIRQAWQRSLRTVLAADHEPVGPAGRAYLAACWLRCDEVDRVAAQVLASRAKAPILTSGG